MLFLWLSLKSTEKIRRFEYIIIVLGYFSYIYVYISYVFCSFFFVTVWSKVLRYESVFIIIILIKKIQFTYLLWLIICHLWYWFSIDTEVLHSGIVPKPKWQYRAIPSPSLLLCVVIYEPMAYDYSPELDDFTRRHNQKRTVYKCTSSLENQYQSNMCGRWLCFHTKSPIKV